MLAVAAGSAGAGVSPDRIDAAVAAARTYLASRLGDDGRCEGEYPSDHAKHLHGGKTAICVYALLAAGGDPEDKPLSDALVWLRAAELNGTYAVALRACALAELEGDAGLDVLRRDVDWLVGAGRDGAYTYGPRGEGDPYDNSNSQMAVLGVRAAGRRGVTAPPAFWKAVDRHWTTVQQPDGGWSYFDRPRSLGERTYGSMTAAGLATLYACFDNLRREQFIRCTAPPEHPPIEDAHAWLAKRFRADANPGKGVEWRYYWLYSVQRVGAASGRRYFGRHDWYAEGAAELVRTQRGDGSWGFGEDRTASTAFALLFLARARAPTAIAKLRYPGRWNARPRDAANFVRWFSRALETPVNWHVVSIDAPLSDWREAPMVYLSGAGPAEFTDEQVDKLRAFALGGGTILTESAGNNADFTLDVHRLCERLFPQYELRRLDESHPIYSTNFRAPLAGSLSAVSNGVRLLLIHSPQELSLALQLGAAASGRETFELAANVLLYATDRADFAPRGASLRPERRDAPPRATIRVARVDWGGNWNPEPLAWERLAVLAHNRRRIRLDVAEGVTPAHLDAADRPVAVITGTGRFEPDAAQRDALRAYVRAGGTLVVDAAGGDETFADSAERVLSGLFPDAVRGPVVSDHPIYSGPEPIERIDYRRGYAIRLGGDRHRPRLLGLQVGERLGVILSREDITAGLLGTPIYGIEGYAPRTAVPLMINILCYAAGMAPAETSTTRPAVMTSPDREMIDEP